MTLEYEVLDAAEFRLREIFLYSLEKFGQERAEEYIASLFARFDDIVERRIAWRPIPAEFETDGFFCRCGRHYVYWKMFDDDLVGIVSILHQSMHQLERFREDTQP